MDPNTGLIRNITQYLESESPVWEHFNQGETCAICLDRLSADTPPTSTRYDRTLLCCSAGHTFHSYCLIGEIFTQRGGHTLQDRCPQCRRRLFADIERIANREKHYEGRWELSKRRIKATAWRMFDSIERVAGQQLNLLHQSDYERGQTAWREVRMAMDQGDIDLFTTAMDRAEELDRDIERRETRR
ncbi:hypothetical protein SLS55_006023 [Diplodia seriata]|uniref:RING-type domain-containing protein n=1 Tax=Diplodia seriata TaxID=420778 RepID=A0ABR3CD22_9PEZI